MKKIFIQLDSNEWHNNYSESVWAELIENNYKVNNVPFYTKDISLGDIVSVKEESNLLWIKEVIKRGGHSTYRVFLNDNVTESLFAEYWILLEEIGCTYEKAFNRFYAIDVPPGTDIYKVYSLLEEGGNNNIWDFEEGFCGHTLKDNTK